jgi:hypothetical protein
MALQIFAILPNSDEEVMFSDCADIPYEVTLSDNVNFEVESRARKFKFFYKDIQLQEMFDYLARKFVRCKPSN